ncbi:hypothetical protein F5Y19DRAFT_83761 [Xylariaceae sp. FL1651]|nr:hypothetical protein F5Y19DRAFT_83761 [Xylariaceae sp. FL1651]
MGGLAFTSGPDPLYTPRMRPEVYRAVRDECQEKLRELFVVVAAPIEAPAKTSFGDIDLFVTWEQKKVFPSPTTNTNNAPLGPLSDDDPMEAIYQRLGAVRQKSEGKEHTMAMAIPWPDLFPYPEPDPKLASKLASLSSEENKNKELEFDKDGKHDTQRPYIQADIHICESLTHLQWMLFKHAHGDLWNILGATIRPFGLTVDEVGMHLRIPEIEEINKKEARVLLSSEPNDILGFLGLKADGKQWEEPFVCDEDIFEYAASCRLFWVQPQERESVDNGYGGGGGGDGIEIEGGDEGNSGNSSAANRRRLKSSDRRRMSQRTLFRKWIDEFLPACRASGRFASSTPLTRDEVRLQAFDYFPGVQTVYNRKAKNWRIRRQRETLWKAIIKPSVPADLDPHFRGCCTSALKKIILGGDDSFDGIVLPDLLQDQDGLFDEDAVRDWVTTNWEEIGKVAWRLNSERYAASLECKGGTKRTASGSEKPVDGDADNAKQESTN